MYSRTIKNCFYALRMKQMTKKKTNHIEHSVHFGSTRIVRLARQVNVKGKSTTQQQKRPNMAKQDFSHSLCASTLFINYIFRVLHCFIPNTYRICRKSTTKKTDWHFTISFFIFTIFVVHFFVVSIYFQHHWRMTHWDIYIVCSHK